MDQNSYQSYLIADMISNIFNFVGQLLLIKIFFEFGKPKSVSQNQTHTNEENTKSNKSSTASMMSGNSNLSNSTYNKEAEMKARIWNQFMRTSQEFPSHTVYADPSILTNSELPDTFSQNAEGEEEIMIQR